MLSETHTVMFDSLGPHGLYRLWNSPGQNTGVGSHSLLQGIFPTQGSNPGLLHYRQIFFTSWATREAHIVFQKIAEGDTLPNSLFEATITLIPKPDKDRTEKENYRTILLTNIDTTFLNKTLTSIIQQHVKRIMHHD